MRAVGMFLLGLLAGYLAILFGWIALADLFDLGDLDGGKIMGVAFGFAPMGGVVAGIVLAILLGRRRARPT